MKSQAIKTFDVTLARATSRQHRQHGLGDFKKCLTNRKFSHFNFAMRQKISTKLKACEVLFFIKFFAAHFSLVVRALFSVGCPLRRAG